MGYPRDYEDDETNPYEDYNSCPSPYPENGKKDDETNPNDDYSSCPSPFGNKWK